MSQSQKEGKQSSVAVGPRGRRSALIIVDMQNDFLPPNGSLSVPNGTKIIPTINDIRQKLNWDMVVLTQDFHPPGHISFYTTHIDKKEAKLYSPLTFPEGTAQMLWPDHCVQGSKGAEFHKDLEVKPSDVIVQKGTEMGVDSYSCFQDNSGKATTQLADRLRKANVTDVYLCGVATDYCVGYSAQDAAKEGFNTFVIEDACAGITEEGVKVTRAKLEKAGVTIIASSVLTEKREDKRMEAAAYLKQHKINDLFERLCSSLVFNQPDDPRAFLVAELEKIQTGQGTNIIQDKDLETIYRMLDPLRQNKVTGKEVARALTEMGMPAEKINIDEKAPVSLEQFKQMATAAFV